MKRKKSVLRARMSGHTEEGHSTSISTMMMVDGSQQQRVTKLTASIASLYSLAHTAWRGCFGVK